MVADITPLAQTHGAPIAQVVVAWTLRQPGITFSLCGARNPDQAAENAKAGGLGLSAKDMAQIDEAVARLQAGFTG